MIYERTLTKLKRADKTILKQQFVIGALITMMLAYALGEFIANI